MSIYIPHRRKKRLKCASNASKDLKHHHLTLPEAADLAQNHPLWRMMSTYGATQSWVARQKRRRRRLSRADNNITASLDRVLTCVDLHSKNMHFQGFQQHNILAAWHFILFYFFKHLFNFLSLLCVCLGCIFSKTAEWIWLKFCTGTEVSRSLCLAFCRRSPTGDRQVRRPKMCFSYGDSSRQCFSLAPIISHSFAR